MPAPRDLRTPEAQKWPDDYLPPDTCGSIDDVQNLLEHLRDANSQLRHAAHYWKRRAGGNTIRLPAVAGGYHTRAIAKGVLGEASKIREEGEEFLDAVAQDCKIMALVELSDMIGAVRAYLTRHHPHMTLLDLVKMSDITARAFASGHRS